MARSFSAMTYYLKALVVSMGRRNTQLGPILY